MLCFDPYILKCAQHKMEWFHLNEASSKTPFRHIHGPLHLHVLWLSKIHCNHSAIDARQPYIWQHGVKSDRGFIMGKDLFGALVRANSSGSYASLASCFFPCGITLKWSFDHAPICSTLPNKSTPLTPWVDSKLATRAHHVSKTMGCRWFNRRGYK